MLTWQMFRELRIPQLERYAIQRASDCSLPGSGDGESRGRGRLRTHPREVSLLQELLFALEPTVNSSPSQEMPLATTENGRCSTTSGQGMKKRTRRRFCLQLIRVIKRKFL